MVASLCIAGYHTCKVIIFRNSANDGPFKECRSNNVVFIACPVFTPELDINSCVPMYMGSKQTHLAMHSSPLQRYRLGRAELLNQLIPVLSSTDLRARYLF